MSVIQSIRDKGAWIIFAIIALALIAFILQDASFRKGSMFSDTTTLAKVNGSKIERTYFEERMELINQMNGGQISREQLMPSVWNMVVEQKVMEQEYDKLGITFTVKELNDLLFGTNPPQWLRQRFTDPNTGMYDEAKARQELAEVKKRPNDPQVKQYYDVFIQPTIEQTLRQKYQALIAQAVYVPKWMAEKNNADNNSIANISYVYAAYSSVSDSSVIVSDDDVKAYVQKHAKEFEQKEESRSISYISFDAFPSAQDSSNLLQQMNALKTEFATTADAKQFVSARGSEMPFTDAFITSTNLKVPNADTIKKLAVGEVFGPYVDGNNFTLARMVEKRTMPDSVKVRHILVKFGEGALTDSAAKKRIDSIAAAAKSGADFNNLVLQFSDDPGSKSKGGEYEFASLQFSNLSKEFAEVAFYGNTGDKKVVKVENSSYSGYHYIEVMQQKNIQTAYKVAYMSKAIVPSDETVNAANNAAQQFAANTKDKKSFDDNAAKQNKTVLVANDIKELDYNVGNLGSNRTFVRWVYENDVNDISEPTQIGDRFIVAIITSVNEKGLMSVQAARPLTEQFIRNEKKAKIIIDTKMKGGSLDAMAQATGQPVQRADSLSFGGFIPGVGNEPKVLGAAFNKDLQGKVSGPIAGANGVYAIKVENIGAKPAMGADVESQRQAAMANLKGQISYRAMDALRQAADVKDYRNKFY